MIRKVFFMCFVMMALLCAFACSEEDKTDDDKKDQTEQPSDNPEEPSDEPKVKEYTVKFIIDNEETVIKVAEGEKVSKPANPEKVGYVFKGWYVGNDVYDFEKKVTSDVELTAKFEKNIKEYTVIFVVVGKAEVQTVKEGEKIAKPADPEKNGFTFVGWYVGDEPYDFEKEVTNDLELTAKFEEIIVEYAVKFVIDGEETVINVAEGEKAIKPDNPEKVGYVFKGWYVDDEEYNFEALVSTDLELTAKFEKISVEIICNDYLFEGDNLELKINIKPFSSEMYINVEILLDDVFVEAKYENGILFYDYNLYGKRDFEILITAGGEVFVEKISFISSDTLVVVVDNGMESGTLKYYYRENSECEFKYYEVDASETLLIYNEIFKNSYWLYKKGENIDFYFSGKYVKETSSNELIGVYKDNYFIMYIPKKYDGIDLDVSVTHNEYWTSVEITILHDGEFVGYIDINGYAWSGEELIQEFVAEIDKLF